MNEESCRSTLSLIKSMQKSLKRDIFLSVPAFIFLALLFYYTNVINALKNFGGQLGFPEDMVMSVIHAALVVFMLFSLKRLREIKIFFNSAVSMSRIDFLTNIYNRRALFEMLEREFNKNLRFPNEHFTFILFDIDNFKNINDTYGHNTGDEVLKTVAATCESVIRKVDICGRFGGDEFGIILPHTSMENGVKVAEKIRKNVNSLKFEFNAEEFYVSLSIGVVAIPAGSQIDSMEKLIDHADKYLYLAKQKGKNCVCSPLC